MSRVKLCMNRDALGSDTSEDGSPLGQKMYYKGERYEVGPSLAKNFMLINAGYEAKEDAKEPKKEAPPAAKDSKKGKNVDKKPGNKSGKSSKK